MDSFFVLQEVAMTGPTASHHRPVKSAAGRLGRHLATTSTTNSNNHVHNKRPAIIDVSSIKCIIRLWPSFFLQINLI